MLNNRDETFDGQKSDQVSVQRTLHQQENAK